jgi:hypothetical protein
MNADASASPSFVAGDSLIRWCRAHPAFGPFGFMASPLAGLSLDVPVRSVEFLHAAPAANQDAPVWATTIFQMMTFGAVVMNFLYACFVMALRSIPLFPRMLISTWAIGLLLQFVIAYRVPAAPRLPELVARSLANLLSNNVSKVLTTTAIWTPYLFLSKRMNVTYRSRVSTG